MDENRCNSELNRLLVNLGRSLLQYVGECWPWTEAEAENRRLTIENMVEAQKDSVARLTELLMQRRWSIDFGGYPTLYTDLHFVALEYLLTQLVESQQAVVDDVGSALNVCLEDEPAATELQHILSTECSILAKLREMADSDAGEAAA